MSRGSGHKITSSVRYRSCATESGTNFLEKAKYGAPNHLIHTKTSILKGNRQGLPKKL